MTASAVSPSAVFRALAHTRRSCRRFQPHRTIDKGVLKDILESTIRSPSGFNLQPTQLLLVQDSNIKNTLADTSMLGLGNQHRCRDASVMAVVLADLELDARLDRIERLEYNKRDANYLATLPIAASFLTGEGHAATWVKQAATTVLSNMVQPMPSIEPVQVWSYKNAGLVAQSLVLAATSHNLATCIMEGYDDLRAKRVLRIPDRYGIPFMVAVGYEYEEEKNNIPPPPTPRLELEEVVFENVFGKPMEFSDDEEEEAHERDGGKVPPSAASA